MYYTVVFKAQNNKTISNTEVMYVHIKPGCAVLLYKV